MDSDDDVNDVRDVDGAFRNVDRSARLEEERETRKLIVPLLDLEVVKIVSHCPSKYVHFVLSLCFNVREIFFGMSTGISDDVIYKVLAENRLSKLEKLTIQNAKKLTMQGIEFLIENCQRLKAVKYLENCELINEFQLREFKQRIKDNNWNLSLEDDCEYLVHDKANFMRQEMTTAWPAVPEFIAS